MLVDGTFPGISFFTKLIVPLKHAYDASDSFGVMRILKDNSPLLKKENIKLHQDQREPFKKAKEATVALFALWENGTPTLYQIAENIYDSGLFDLPPLISLIIETTKRIEQTGVVEDDIPATAEQAEGDRDTRSKRSDAWGQALQSSYTEIEAYAKYIADDSRFGTHQGVKGREFERVMVITDDVEARGFAFSYDRIFGATPAGTSEQKNAAEGRETILDRTLRLFYVACSRAEKSLAIVAYTDAPEEVKKNAVKQGWFAESEITII
jgi:DNA helicase-2/ATP-dependent DNA helicase PcrA